MIVSQLIKEFSQHLFVEHSIRDVVFGYQDIMLKMGKILDPSRFYTDIVGILAGVSYPAVVCINI